VTLIVLQLPTPANGPQHQRQSGVKYRTEASTIIKKGNKEEIGLEVWTKKVSLNQEQNF
jgi:hypothetical protein